MSSIKTLDDRFRAQVALNPQTTALVERRFGSLCTLSYQDLDTRVQSLATQLSACGVEHEDSVLLLEPISLRFYALLLALFRVGATVVLPDPSDFTSTLTAASRIARPKALIGPGRAQLLRWFLADLRRIPLALSSDLPYPGTAHLCFHREPECRGRSFPQVDPSAVAILRFTSGTTGDPKAVPRSHEKLLAQQHALDQVLKLEPHSRCLSTLQIFVLTFLAAGSTAVLPWRGTGGSLRRQLIRDRIETLLTPPPLARRLVADVGGSKGPDRPKLAQIITGGGLVEPQLLRDLAETFPPARVVSVYAASEAEPIATLEESELTVEHEQRWHEGAGIPVGRPVNGIRVAIESDSAAPQGGCAADNPLRRGPALAAAIGEVLLSGDHVITANPKRIASDCGSPRMGDRIWHRTGDAGYVDEACMLWLVGRVGQKAEGASVYPLQVEGVVRRLINGKDLAVVTLDGRLTLAVAETLGPQRAALEQGLRSFGEIRIVDRLGTLPRDRRHRAKPDIRRLRTMVGKRAAQDRARYDW